MITLVGGHGDDGNRDHNVGSAARAADNDDEDEKKRITQERI